jgi:hypothetical protein
MENEEEKIFSYLQLGSRVCNGANNDSSVRTVNLASSKNQIFKIMMLL